MTTRTEGETSPYWKRVEIVMNVQQGTMTVADAARALAVTRQHYYALEEAIVRAALLAATPQKRGPKVVTVDPRLAELQAKLSAADRERELLGLQLEHLRHLHEEMKKQLAAEGGGKKPRRRRSAGATLRPTLPPTEPDVSGEGTHGGPDDGRRASGVGSRPHDDVSMETGDAER